MAKDPAPTRTAATPQTTPAPDRTDGPTLEDFTAAGYAPAQYPPPGYAEVPSPGLTAYRATGAAPDLNAETHIVVRARVARFRRAGLTFTADHQVYSMADLGPDKMKAIESETMLDVRRISTGEASRFKLGAIPDDDDGVTKAELRQWVAQERARADRAEQELITLKARLSGADYPPKKIEDLPGGPPPRL